MVCKTLAPLGAFLVCCPLCFTTVIQQTFVHVPNIDDLSLDCLFWVDANAAMYSHEDWLNDHDEEHTEPLVL